MTGVKYPTLTLRKFSTRPDVMLINETLTDEALHGVYNKRIERVDQFAIKIASITMTSLFYVDIGDVKLRNYDNRTNGL